MTRAAFVFMLAGSLALAASPAIAQDPLSKRVSLDLKAMAPADAFKVIGDSVGMKVTVGAKVTAPIDILVRDVTAKTALTTICESIGCTWTVTNGTVTVSPVRSVGVSTPGQPVFATVEQKKLLMERIQASLKRPLPSGMTFENATLGEVSAKLSEALDLKVELTSSDPALRTLTADFSNQTLLDALKRVFPQGESAYSWRMVAASRDGHFKSASIMLGIKVDAKKK
jgi:hypothetical protein